MSVSGPGRVIDNGLVLYLDASNNKSFVSGSNTWFDVSRNNNSGSLVNGPTYTSSFGGSIVFDGTNDYVLVDSSTIIPGLTSFTLCVWLNYTIPAGNTFRDIINTRESTLLAKGFLLS